ncbi:RimK family alpha-L-glutamate ligase [Vibrio breoganii]
MKIALESNNKTGFFTERWKNIAEEMGHEVVLVDFKDNDIISKLVACDACFWHFSHAEHPDYYLGKVITNTLSNSSCKSFPTFQDSWHFDDKIAQKYLLESINAPVPRSFVFYSFKEVNSFLKDADFPMVAKLKGGASSTNVKLLNNKTSAFWYSFISFYLGHRSINRFSALRFSYGKLLASKTSILNFSKDLAKIFVRSPFEKYNGSQKGYILLQEFLPNNDFDQRVVVIGNRAFALIRYANENDFRASGTGNIEYDRTKIDMRCIEIAFEISSKLGTTCLAFDFLYGETQNPLIAEVSYGFHQDAYDDCQGYWKRDLTWIDKKVEPQRWMIEEVLSNDM